MFLGEEVRVFRLSAVGIGLIGVMIVIAPRLGDIGRPGADLVQTLGAVVALGAAVMGAMAQVFVRKMVQSRRPRPSCSTFRSRRRRCRW